MIPTTSHSSFLITLSTPDIVWIDKSFAIPALLYLNYPNKKLPIVRRPSGFGKTSIISMFDHFLSVHKDSRSDSSTLFTATCIADVFSTDSPRSMLAKADFQNHLFLEIDLDGLEVTSEEVFKTSLLNRIARCMMWFMRRYRWLLDADGSKRFSPVIRDNEGHLSIAGTIIVSCCQKLMLRALLTYICSRNSSPIPIGKSLSVSTTMTTLSERLRRIWIF